MSQRTPELPVVFATLPACPSCDSTNINRGGGTVKLDYGKAQYSCCLDCGERFKVIWESPSPFSGEDI